MQQYVNILVSGCVSLVISMTTFILGLKAGKNQSDRQIFKNKYKNISVHFNDLLTCIKTAKPKRWSSYKSVKIGIDRSQYVPLLTEMEINGESIELKKKIINIAKQLEKDSLNYSNRYYGTLDKIGEYILNSLPSCCDTIRREGDYSVTTISKANDVIGISQYSVNCGILIFKDELERYCNLVKQNERGAINFETSANQKLRSITIGKNTLNNKELDEFLKEIYIHFQQDEEIKKLIIERDLLIKRIEKIIKQVNKRVKEPFTFSETIFGAIMDVFKV